MKVVNIIVTLMQVEDDEELRAHLVSQHHVRNNVFICFSFIHCLYVYLYLYCYFHDCFLFLFCINLWQVVFFACPKCRTVYKDENQLASHACNPPAPPPSPPRPTTNHDNKRKRDRDRDRERDRERDRDREDRDRHRDSRDKDREGDRYRDGDGDRARGRDREDRDRHRDSRDRDREGDRDSRDRDRGRDRERDRDREDRDGPKQPPVVATKPKVVIPEKEKKNEFGAVYVNLQKKYAFFPHFYYTIKNKVINNGILECTDRDLHWARVTFKTYFSGNKVTALPFLLLLHLLKYVTINLRLLNTNWC